MNNDDFIDAECLEKLRKSCASLVKDIILLEFEYEADRCQLVDYAIDRIRKDISIFTDPKKGEPHE